MCMPPLWPKRTFRSADHRLRPRCDRRSCRSSQSGCRRNISTTPPDRNCSSRSRCCRNIIRPAPSSRSCATAADEISAIIPKGAALVEFGAGATTKVRLLLNECAFSAYVPVDISGDFLKSAGRRPAQGFPRSRRLSGGGGFHRAVRVARRDRRHAEGRILSGLDARQFRAARGLRLPAQRPRNSGQRRADGDRRRPRKGRARAVHAYNDAAGVTARFNLNVLVRINRELGGNFDTVRPSPIARSTTATGTASKCT